MKTDASSSRGTCGDGHPVDVLTQEHRTIVAVLEAIEHEVRHLRDGRTIDEPFWRRALEFLEHFADRCHHEKEEQLLFVELERAGVPAADGPTACMRAEHEVGRRGRAAMSSALGAADARSLAAAAAAYVELLREHIGKEDDVLFPMAKSVLDPAAVERLRAGFAKLERDELGDGAHARYERLARELGGRTAAAP